MTQEDVDSFINVRNMEYFNEIEDTELSSLGLLG